MASDRPGGGIVSALLLALFSFAGGAGVMYYVLTGHPTESRETPAPPRSPEPSVAVTTPFPVAPEPWPSDQAASPEPSPGLVADGSQPAVAAPADAAPAAPAGGAPRPARARPRAARDGGAQTGGAAAPATGTTTTAVAPTGPAAMPAAGHFAMGRTAVESRKSAAGQLKGFDESGVGLKRAPDVVGRLDLQVEPANARPGQPFRVKVFLANEGSKAIRLRDLAVSTVVDGHWSHRSVAPPSGEIRPRQRLLLHEVTGEWQSEVRSWALEVVATSDREDVYRNALYWQ